jgi:hypothetical protein
MMNADVRHYCRFTRCRSKLPEPVENDRHAFCTRGCHAGFYRKRCLVCEKPIVGGRENRRFCKGDKCAAKHRQNPEIYRFWGIVPPSQVKASEVPVKWAFKSGVRTGRGWRWDQCGEEHWLLDREEVLARVSPDGGGHIVRLSPGIDYGVSSPLDDTKRLAISLALAILPLNRATAKHVEAINRLPEVLPQNLMPSTAAYLAGLAQIQNEQVDAPSIVPPDGGALGDLEIPSFLQRCCEGADA